MEADAEGHFVLFLCVLGWFMIFKLFGYWVIFQTFCQLLTFSNNHFFKSSFSNTIRVSKSLDPDQDQHSVLIWVQTVCKGYQQKTKVAAGIERVK